MPGPAREENRETSSIKRISSGIEGLDKKIMGGLPEGTTTLVYGPPKAGKSTFAFQFLNQCISNREGCLFVMADYVVDDLFLATSGFGWQVKEAVEKESVRLVDMSSTHAEKQPDSAISSGNLLLASLANPTDLMAHSNEVVRRFASSQMKFRTILDSLTPLFIYNPPMIVAKVLRQFAQRMKSAGSEGFVVTYAEGSVDPQSETIIKSSVDNLIHLKEGELVIEGMIGTPKITSKYEIRETGILLT